MKGNGFITGKSTKGEENMNASVLKPGSPFVAKGALKRTPASENNRKMIEFLDSHDFSFSVDKDTGKLNSTITEKK